MSKSRIQPILCSDADYPRKLLPVALASLTNGILIDTEYYADFSQTGDNIFGEASKALQIVEATGGNGAYLLALQNVNVMLNITADRDVTTAAGYMLVGVGTPTAGVWQTMFPFPLWRSLYAVDSPYTQLTAMVPLTVGQGLYMYNDTDSGDFVGGMLIATQLQPV